METAFAFNPCGTLRLHGPASIFLKDTMKTTILTAAMREALMRAYLQIQVNQDQEALTIDYAARLSTMPDSELIERLVALSRDAFEPNRIAQEALVQWRQQERLSQTPDSKACKPQATNDEDVMVVSAVLNVVYKCDAEDDAAALVEGLQKELQDVIDHGEILTASNSAEVVDYHLAVY